MFLLFEMQKQFLKTLKIQVLEIFKADCQLQII